MARGRGFCPGDKDETPKKITAKSHGFRSGDNDETPGKITADSCGFYPGGEDEEKPERLRPKAGDFVWGTTIKIWKNYGRGR